MSNGVRGTGQKNPVELTVPGEFMRSKMLEIPAKGHNGEGKRIAPERPWDTASFEMIDFSKLSAGLDRVREGLSNNQKTIDPEEFRRTAEATVISGFVRRGVDYKRIDPEVLNRIADAYVTSDQRELSLIQRALTLDEGKRQEKARYVNWSKVAPSEQFGEFSETVSLLREGAPEMRVGQFLDHLAKSERAPKLPKGGNGTGGGKVDTSKMTTTQLLVRYRGSPMRRAIIAEPPAGIPPQVAVSVLSSKIDVGVRAPAVTSYAQPPRQGVVATFAQGLRLFVAPKPVTA